MKKILVAIDYSFASINAAKYAVELAVDIQADIILFNVYQLPASSTHLASFLTLEEKHQNAELKLDAVKSELDILTQGKLDILNLIKTGSFFNVLQETCEEINPDLVIIGSQGTTASERLILGGHAVHAMIHLNCAIISIPVKASYNKINKIALASEFENTVESIPVSLITKLVNTLQAKLYIVHADKMGKGNLEAFYKSKIFQQTFDIPKPEIHFITVEKIDKGIMDFVEDNQIDLLIVLPKHRDSLQTLFHSSNTKQFVLHCQVPVMTLHY